LQEWAALCAPDLPQFAFERPGAREKAAVELAKIVVGREKHEAAGHANCNADRTPVELNCETLAWH